MNNFYIRLSHELVFKLINLEYLFSRDMNNFQKMMNLMTCLRKLSYKIKIMNLDDKNYCYEELRCKEKVIPKANLDNFFNNED